MSLIRLFLARNTSGISGLPEIFRSRSGKDPSKAEVFPARKILISDIPGFPAGDRDHSRFNSVGQPKR